MNITYIIGNGFDLGLGLKTSYRHFVNAYLYMPPDEAVFVSNLQCILRNYDAASTWADAEIEFAKLQFTQELNAGSNFDREMLQVAEEFRTELENILNVQPRQRKIARLRRKCRLCLGED